MKKQNKQPNGKVKKVGAYIRVSTEEQAQNPEGSIKNQEERIRQALAFKNAGSPFGELCEVFIDRGLSGKDMNRPEMKRLLKKIESGEIDLVIVTELSRLSRSIKDFSHVWEFMQESSCGLWSLRENFDTSTAAGEMMLFSIMNFAQFERKQTSERVAANFESRASRGLYNGGPLPHGFAPDPLKKGALIVMENEADTIREAFMALIRAGSIAAAAKLLNGNGRRYGGELRGGGSKPRLAHFTVANLSNLLNNKAYMGVRAYKTKSGERKETKAAWEPIINADTFRMAQELINSTRRRKIDTERRYPFLLSKKVFCGQCGFAMNGKSAHGNGGKIPYYEHGAQIKRDACLSDSDKASKPKCSPFRVLAKVLEQRVWEEIEKLIRSPGLSSDFFTQDKSRAEKQSDGHLYEQLTMKIRSHESKIQALTMRLSELPLGVSAKALYDAMKRLESDKTAVNEELRTLKQRKPEEEITGRSDYERFLAKLYRYLNSNAAFETRQRIVEALIHRIEVTEDGFNLHFYMGVDQIKKGEALASPLDSFKKFFSSRGSKRLTIGCGDWIRTSDLFVPKQASRG